MIKSIEELKDKIWEPSNKHVCDMSQDELLEVLLSVLNDVEEFDEDRANTEKILRTFQYGRGI